MPSVPQFPPSFLLLQQEGHLISSCLSTGLTNLRAAHVHNKGGCYAALFNLSIGTERLLKAIIIIDHMLKNDLAVPTKVQLQKYGHNIIELHQTCYKISLTEERKLVAIQEHEEIDREMVTLLSDFGKSTRYHNLDTLASQTAKRDPLTHFNDILNLILKTDVPDDSKKRILMTAKHSANSIDDYAYTLMHGLDKQSLSTVQALALPGLHDLASRYAVLHLVNFLASIRDLISDLSHKAYALGAPVPPFPQMQEFLEWLWEDRSHVLRKKRWP